VAAELSLVVVGGSDPHFWAQVGIKATVIPVASISQASVSSAIRQHRAAVECRPYGPLAVEISKTYKRTSKPGGGAGWSDPPRVRRRALSVQTS